MKNLSILIFFVFTTTIGYSQKKITVPDQNKMSLVEVMVAAGISSASSTFSDNSYAADGSFFELSSTYYFSKIGLGATFGSFSNPTEGNLLDFANQLDYPIALSSEKWKTSYIGFGPSYRANIGSLEAIFFAQAGSMTVKPISLSGNFSVENADVSTTIPVYDFGTKETSKTGFYNAGIKLGYKLSPNLGLYLSANYLSAFSDKIIAQDGRKNITDNNKNGIIDAEDFVGSDGVLIDFTYSDKNIQPQVFNYGFGLSYGFGKRTIKIGGTEKPYARENEGSNNQEKTSKRPINSGSVVFTNPAKENNKEERKLVNVQPSNNSTFESTNSISNFNWKVIGKAISNPQFIIEVVKMNNLRKPERTFVQTTKQTSLKSSEIFKDEQLSDGQYMWKVTETTTGISSNPSYFSMAPCEINFSITNDSIECLGYEGENRKFKICFDSTYQSNSGNLTFTPPTTDLFVWDQSNTPLTYTLVAPNPTLLTQIGATTTTFSYCFEVVVSNSVTSIGFGLQGDDLDPSQIVCQPGVSANFNDLPDCLCDDCEEIELSFDDFNIKPGNTGNQFDFIGNINVNVPIYGIEFQIQSYNYTANPGPCTAGVTSVEESGMFLVPSTTINNSMVQLFNETISGSTNTNNNATKDIKYSSGPPLTGPIPVNLTIGLPGPISGLDPSCCVIDYEVCIKVIIFYEDGSCKSCDFTHCFQFNNQ